MHASSSCDEGEEGYQLKDCSKCRCFIALCADCAEGGCHKYIFQVAMEVLPVVLDQLNL